MTWAINQIIRDAISWIDQEYDQNIKSVNTDTEEAITCFFKTELDYAKAISRLLESGDFIGVPPIFRSLYEAYVDLKNLCNDAGYYNYLLALSDRKEIKRMEYNKNKGIQIPDHDINNIISELNTEIENIETEAFCKKYGKKKGYRYSFENRFSLADGKEEYNIVYDILSFDSHNDLKSVLNRCKRKKENISIQSDLNLYSVSSHIAEIPRTLIGSVMFIYEYFNIERSNILIPKNSAIYRDLKPLLGIPD